MTKKEFYNHPGWRWCTAQGARDQVLLIGLQTTFRQKLEWLEEAETLALRLQGKLDAPAHNPAPERSADQKQRPKRKVRSQKSEVESRASAFDF